ncbi:PCYCGC motif-containing (lipo)protein [Paenibacillus puerhi]|uniref:PCYCGC motif-containing (lipo)protein n=1 Tax=Paenibacillus puerhi TaxID=2692622 RepID=UPI00135CA4CA|nr:PCYCGC motif-containing (lipo)protein [Paenibacillus puerhi]
MKQLKRMKPLLALVLLASIATACAPKPEAATSHAGHEQHQGSGDIQETTASATVLPKFLDKQSEEIRLVYQAAGQATEILKWMPCYCGCGDSVGHQSNMNCFIQEVKPGGSVVWDDHGTRCGVCLQIAVKSIKLTQDGKSLREIRQTIDQTYKQGYAKPTPTPMPT